MLMSRRMSERYPAISQLIAENRIPEFDNLCKLRRLAWVDMVAASNQTIRPRHEWYHPQLHPQRFRFTYVSHERGKDVHCHLQLH